MVAQGRPDAAGRGAPSLSAVPADAQTQPSDARPDLATEADLEALVRRFYTRARADDVLGPVFSAADLDWDAHIGRVVSFWSWQLLGGRRYDGRPLRSHQRVHAVVPFTEEHYERWLELFRATLHERWSGPVTELAEQRARRMARSMRRVLAGTPDPEPSWPEEGVEPGDSTAEGGRGLVLPVAMGPTARRRAAPPEAGTEPTRGGASGPSGVGRPD